MNTYLDFILLLMIENGNGEKKLIQENRNVIWYDDHQWTIHFSFLTCNNFKVIFRYFCFQATIGNYESVNFHIVNEIFSWNICRKSNNFKSKLLNDIIQTSWKYKSL